MEVQEWLENNQLSLDIWNKKYRNGTENFEEWLDRVSGGNSEIKRLIREKKFLFGGRTLANRGIPNSGSFSNCYSIGFVPDSLDGIMDVATKIAMTFKAQGGQGLSLSKIRPKGSLIAGQFKSDGIVPFMHIFNTVTESISQGGSRKGALLMSIDAEHPQALDFIRIKENPNEINKANLSVEISDLVMQTVEANINKPLNFHNLSWDLHYQSNLVEVFNAICKSAWKSAEPGIIFTNRFRNYNLMEFINEYAIEVCNPCGEQPLPKHGACNLCSINVSEYVLDPYTNKARIDYISLGKDIETIISEMDRVLEENLERHALPEQKEMAKKYRNIGCGIMGLADLFVKLGIKYGSSDSIGIVHNLMKYIFRESVKVSAANGKIYGNFPGYSPKVWDSTIIKNAFSSEEIEEFKKQNTLRNCSLLSIAPTGSIGTLLSLGGTGCEPFFALSFNRKTDNLNGTYKVELPIIEEYRKVTGNQGKLPDYFITSKDIYWKDRVDVQATLQEFCDTAISSTVNLSKETTIDDIKQLYIYAWKKGCKGITVFREGSRDPILFTEPKKEEKISEQVSLNTEDAKLQLEGKHELRRGEIVKTGDHWLGLKRTLTTGCGTLHCEAFFDPNTGELRECYLSKGSTGGCNNFMIGLSRMISLASRGGVGIDNILDQLKSCGTCPSYAVRQATKKDTSKGSCCPVAVGNALRDMHKEIQDIICECKGEDKKLTAYYIPGLYAFNPGETIPEGYITLDEIPRKEGQSQAEATKEYIQNLHKNSSLEECPSCHEKTLIHTGGCVSCINCSWTRCS